MSVGNFKLGEDVVIPFQITDSGIPISDSEPYIEKIILPSGKAASGFPSKMTVVDASLGTYKYTYTSSVVGTYIVIITVVIDGDTYTFLDNFVVSSSSSAVPRAIAK